VAILLSVSLNLTASTFPHGTALSAAFAIIHSFSQGARLCAGSFHKLTASWDSVKGQI
jgi:hypothetical protein